MNNSFKLKLHKDNISNFKTTPNGLVINKEEFTVIEKADIHIEYIMQSQKCIIEKMEKPKPKTTGPLEAKDKVKEDKSKAKPKATASKFNEGKVEDTIIDSPETQE